MTGFRLADGGGPVIPNYGEPSACLRHNGWFCTDWIHEHWGDTLQPALIQHIQLTLIAVGIGFVIARWHSAGRASKSGDRVAT